MMWETNSLSFFVFFNLLFILEILHLTRPIFSIIQQASNKSLSISISGLHILNRIVNMKVYDTQF